MMTGAPINGVTALSGILSRPINSCAFHRLEVDGGGKQPTETTDDDGDF
ncbi:hypothetical protein [Prevotella corporis]|nr:hypothetical protein [Prevotella corporis]